MGRGNTSTPHARGSTLPPDRPDPAGAVYPACAGIHLSKWEYGRAYESLPRMRGDPPRTR